MNFDVIIIGAGPSGLTAGIYTCRAGLRSACFEGLAIGGQASLSYDISNYPGFNSINGFELMDKIHKHATEVGLTTIYERVIGLKKVEDGFELRTKDKVYHSKKVIIASGCVARQLGLDNERSYIGKGVSYCASCDGAFYKDKIVAVVGGGDSAMEYVDYLSNIAKKIYLINRSERFKAGEHKLKKAQAINNVEIITNAQVVELHGDKHLKRIEIDKLGDRELIDVDGLFIAIGHEPRLDYLDIDLELSEHGYIKVDSNMCTNIEGLYACGDVIDKDFRQVITACADGAVAGNSCIRGINANEE